MNYRTFADLSTVIASELWRLPPDLDLVVGIPRSGMLPANMIALLRNLPLTDLRGLQEDRIMTHGRTRGLAVAAKTVAHCRSILVVDDSIQSGQTMAEAKRTAAELGLSAKIHYLAVYSTKSKNPLVDTVLQICPPPRVFQWNVMHSWVMDHACVDIDGVLCRDPSEEENDDGERYLRFLETVAPLALPTRPVLHLVSSRLERYREPTVRWLEKHGVEFRQLSLLNLPTAEDRRKAMAHGPFKADVYKRCKDAMLFIESEPGQARTIADISGKSVLWFNGQCIVSPGSTPLARYNNRTRNTIRFHSFRLRRKLRRRVGLLLSKFGRGRNPLR